MTDPEEERLTVPSNHIHPQFSSNLVSVPPFAPTPHYALNISNCDGHATYRTASTSTGRSGTLATTSHVQSNAKSDCNIHEVCHYFQQVIFVLAILTGIALVIAGSVMQTQTGELVVFVYIGALLISVNSALLSIQCYVRRKQKRRQRTHTASRSTVSAPTAQHTNNLQYTTTGVPQAETRHYFVNHGPGGTAVLQPFLDNHLMAGSPTESTAKYYSSMHSMVSLHPGSVGSHGHHYHHHHHHHHQNKDKYHQSPPMGQQGRAHGLHVANVPLLPTPRSDLGVLVDGPPPSYAELSRTGRLPPEGTTVHLL